MTGVIEDKRGQLLELCQRRHVRRLELFGSAAIGRYDPSRSDLDFIVFFEEPQTPREHADRFFGLLADLQDLFERDIDLIELHTITNPYFLRSIEKTRALVYETGREKVSA